MTNALKYCLSLHILENDYDDRQFIKFCHEIYVLLLDDYIHIITLHNNDLIDIFHLLIEEYKFNTCDIQNCKILSRHYSNDIDYKYSYDNDDDHYDDLIFYTNIIDSMHCYLIHMYDTGMRINFCDDIKSNQDDNLQCFDVMFSNITKLITDKKKQFQSLNKFNIDINCFDTIDLIEDELFIDKLFMLMENNINLNANETFRLKQMFLQQEYDSDAIIYDINAMENVQNINNSNIATYINNTQQCQFIKMYTTCAKSVSMQTPDIGCKFLYWEYYKNKTEHCFGGYKQCELYISCKYSTLKDEILNNKILSLPLNIYKIYSNKSQKYLTTIKIKKHMCWIDEDPLHFSIDFGARLSFYHLLSIILYCDSIHLSQQLKITFKKNHKFESIKSIKNRNSEFCHWSKTLIETVEYFGDSFCRTDGSVYCVIPNVIMSTFYLKINQPISATKYIEIICMKSDSIQLNKGLIIELNDSGTWHDFSLDSFCCSWISHYLEEEEYIFCGGNYRIKIQSILNIKTKENFNVFFRAFFSFQFMINGGEIEDFVTKPYIDVIDYYILNNLIQHKMKMNGFINKYSKYINYTFESFTNNIQEIIINLDFIERYFLKLKDLIIYPISNTPKETIWKLFPNIKYVLIYSTDQNGRYTQYPIELDMLLCVLSKVSSFIRHDMEIEIKATHKYIWNGADVQYEWDQRSWIFDAYSQNVETEFRKHKFYMDLKQTATYDEYGNQRKQDCLFITKYYQQNIKNHHLEI